MRVDVLLSLHGVDANLLHLAPEQPNFDELRGEWIGEPVFESVPVRVIVRPLKAEERQTVAGLENQEAVEIILTEPVTLKDYIEIENTRYKIARVDKVFHDGKVLYYKAIGVVEK